MMTNSEVNGVLRRIKNIKSYWYNMSKNEGITEEEKKIATESFEAVNNLINKMCSYTWAVFEDKTSNLIREDRGRDVEERQGEISENELARKIAHDGLIVQIKWVDKMCRMAGLEEVYGKLPNEYKEDTSGLMGEENRSKPGVVETRHAIARWSFDMVISCMGSIYLDIGDLDYDTNPDTYNEISQNKGRKVKIKDDMEWMTEPEK